MSPGLLIIGHSRYRIWLLLNKELVAELAIGQTSGSRLYLWLAAAIFITGNDIESEPEKKIIQVAKNRGLLS